MNKDLYEVLGVSKTATDEEIQKAYRKLAFAHHPDRNPGDKAAEDRFKEAANAYETLSDPGKRAAYDRPAPSGFRPPQGNPFHNPFNGFHQANFGTQPTARGNDVHTKVTITLEEAATGCVKSVPVPRRKVCPSCTGHGGVSSKDCNVCGGVGHRVMQQGPFTVQMTCPICNGEGREVVGQCKDCYGDGLTIPDRGTIDVRIPAGVNGQQGLRIANEGEPGRHPNARKPGDLYVQVNIKDHDLFVLDGTNLVMAGVFSYAELALGCKVEIPALFDTSVEVDVPGGTSPGMTLRVAGHGFVDMRGNRGDLMIQIHMECPADPQGDYREVLERLAEVEKKAGHTPGRTAFGKLVTIRDR